MLSIFCVLAAILTAMVIGVNRMNIGFINYDMFGCKQRKPTRIGLSS